jgi:hypothetical protein
MTRIFHALMAVVALGASVSIGQETGGDATIPAAVQWTIDAAGPVQRVAIKSVFLLYCPKTNMKGTGFLLSSA